MKAEVNGSVEVHPVVVSADIHHPLHDAILEVQRS
jgi:hypothetical protein